MPKEHHDDLRLSWPALLGAWTEFAQASLALPDEGEGARWKAAVPGIIGLQALTHALAELFRVEPIDRPAALDRAAVGIREHSGAVVAQWGSEPLPESLIELLDDAREALIAAQTVGVQWVLSPEAVVDADPVFAHPADLAGELAASGLPDLEVFLPSPGIPMRPGAVVATLRRANALPVEPDLVETVEGWLSQQAWPLDRIEGRPVAQVYRQFDFAQGGPVRDVVVPACGEPLAGQPLLVPAVMGGKPCPVSLPPRAPIEIGELPVEDRLGLVDDA